jgi:hypothetical protein
MAVIVSAGPNPYGGTFVELFASGGTAPYVWRAFPTGADDYVVPPTTSQPNGSATFDGYAPLGRPILYRATDSTGATGEAVTELVDPGSALLSDALDPNRVAAVTVVDQLPNAWQGRSVWFDILDRRDPFVAVAPLRLRDGTITLRVSGVDERRALLALLETGNPLVLRSACTEAVDDVVLLPMSVDESLVLDDDKSGPRDVAITYQAVTRDLGPYYPDPEWRWADVVADPRHPSWTALVASYASWADVVANVRKP